MALAGLITMLILLKKKMGKVKREVGREKNLSTSLLGNLNLYFYSQIMLVGKTLLVKFLLDMIHNAITKMFYSGWMRLRIHSFIQYVQGLR